MIKKRRYIVNWLDTFSKVFSSKNNIAYIWESLSFLGSYLGSSTYIIYNGTKIYPNLWLLYCFPVPQLPRITEVLVKYIEIAKKMPMPVYTGAPKISQLREYLRLSQTKRLLATKLSKDQSFICLGDKPTPLIPTNLAVTYPEKFYKALDGMYRNGSYVRPINTFNSITYNNVYSSLVLCIEIERLQQELYQWFVDQSIWQHIIPIYFNDKNTEQVSLSKDILQHLAYDLTTMLEEGREYIIEESALLEYDSIKYKQNPLHIIELNSFYEMRWKYILQLALLFTVLSGTSCIESKQIQTAVRLLDKTEEFFSIILRNVANNDIRATQLVLSTIREYGGTITVNQLVANLLAEFPNKEELQLIIRNLIRDNVLEYITKGTTPLLHILDR